MSKLIKFDCMEHHINGNCLYCLLNEKKSLTADLTTAQQALAEMTARCEEVEKERDHGWAMFREAKKRHMEALADDSHPDCDECPIQEARIAHADTLQAQVDIAHKDLDVLGELNTNYSNMIKDHRSQVEKLTEALEEIHEYAKAHGGLSHFVDHLRYRAKAALPGGDDDG